MGKLIPRGTYEPWTDRLAYDVALALEGQAQDLTPVLARNGVEPATLPLYLSDPVFLKTVLALREEIAAKGVVFQARARSLAEDVLHTTHRLSRDADVSPSVRLQAAQSVVRWAGYDKPAEDLSSGTGAVTISINIGGDHRSVTLAQPVDDEPPARRPLRHDARA